MSRLLLPNRRVSLAVATVASLAVAGLAGTTSYAAGGGQPVAGSLRAASTEHNARGYLDTRTEGARTQVTNLRTQSGASARPATRAFRASSPGQTVLDIAGSTGTVRMLTRLDGFLTKASGKPAPAIARAYVAQHHAALGLTQGDLKTFHLVRNYRDIAGQHHLYFEQRISGHKVIGNGLTASVNKGGHLLTVGGSPVSKANAAIPAATGLRLASPSQALAQARGTAAPGADLSQDGATGGLFVTPTGVHLAWQTIVMSSAVPAMSVLDARTGAVLQRQPLVNYESSDSTGKVYRFFPGAPRGGKHVKVDFTKRGWLGRHASILKGFAKSFCDNPWPCSWNPNKPFSWKTNRAQDATQVFYFVNTWHDHLRKAPIGFTEAAGNFQASNSTKHGKPGDAVNTQTDDGANTDHGLPDGSHIDNANMSTPPDGHNPRMQMYLQHQPGTSYPDGDPFSPTNVGDEADTVYHEYTHGLSNRLSVDVQGSSTLGGVQAGAMGEAWSDWYAMDFLAKKGLQKDVRSKADVRLFVYDGVGVNYDRTEPIDCAVGQKVRLCNGGATGHRGGYTYRDYAHVAGGPEVHGDGEIWAQTLWSLRYQIGSRKSESLVTRAMEMAPFNPSFLDMRNAILVADNSLYGGKGRAAIWKVFAHRGMGFFAGSLGGGDSQPGWSFATPPKQLKPQTISGRVTDADTHLPVANLPVTLAFQGAGTANPTSVTDSGGHYSITGVPQGTYTKLQVVGAGYQGRKKVTVGSTGAVANFSLHKDLASTRSGASVVTSTGAVFGGCGPTEALDQNQATGWSVNIAKGQVVANTGTFHPKYMVVDLGQHANLTGFAVDPSASCGDGGSASTAGYTIQTSPTGTAGTWTTAATGTFTSADNGTLNHVTPTAGTAGVEFLKFQINSNQTPDFAHNCPDGGYSGCAFVDLTEFQVYGVPTP